MKLILFTFMLFVLIACHEVIGKINFDLRYCEKTFADRLLKKYKARPKTACYKVSCDRYREKESILTICKADCPCQHQEQPVWKKERHFPECCPVCRCPSDRINSWTRFS